MVRIRRRTPKIASAAMASRTVAMLAILYALGMFVADLFKSRTRLEAENVFLRSSVEFGITTKASSHSTAGQ
jgi:hypothetical protein